MEQVNKTNIELLDIKQQYGLSLSKIASLLDCSVQVIKNYSCSPESTAHRNIPAYKLKLLKMMIKQRKMKPIKA